MSTKSYVSMTFSTDNFKKASINVQNPKQDLTSEDINNVMNTISQSKAFETKAGIFVANESAKLVTVEETPFEIEK